MEGMSVSDEDKERVFQRSMAYRQAEKDLLAAMDSEGEEQAKAAHKAARSKWRDATDHVRRKSSGAQ